MLPIQVKNWIFLYEVYRDPGINIRIYDQSGGSKLFILILLLSLRPSLSISLLLLSSFILMSLRSAFFIYIKTLLFISRMFFLWSIQTAVFVDSSILLQNEKIYIHIYIVIHTKTTKYHLMRNCYSIMHTYIPYYVNTTRIACNNTSSVCVLPEHISLCKWQQFIGLLRSLFQYWLISRVPLHGHQRLRDRDWDYIYSCYMLQGWRFVEIISMEAGGRPCEPYWRYMVDKTSQIFKLPTLRPWDVTLRTY